MGCTDGGARALVAERDQLAVQVKALQDTITELRMTPAARFAAAVSAEEAGQVEEAERGYQVLVAQYAAAPEARAAETRLEAIGRARAHREAETKAAAARAERERTARERALLTGITKKYDEMQGTTWYTPKGAGGFSIPVHLYLGEKAGNVWLRMWMGTSTEDWLFWERVIFNVDGQIETYHVERSDKETEVITGGVLEWTDVLLDETWEAQFRRMAHASLVKVRFEGKYRRDVTLSEGTKDKLQLILDLYDKKRGQELSLTR
jgi:hypothetical protein